MSALPGKPASNSVQSGHDQLLSVSPGERLQKARKENKLEVPEVAERLNLSPGVVRALEADDYRMLPNATFVKGYLRSYARTLGINGDDLVRAYEAITGCNQPVKIEPIAAPMISESRKTLRNIAVVLTLVVLVVVLWWTMGSGDSASERLAAPEPSAQTESAPADAGASQTPVNPPIVVTRPAETEAAIAAEAEAVNEPVEGSDEPVSPAATEVAEPVVAEPSEPVSVTPDVGVTETAPQTAVEASAPVSSGSTSITTTGSGLVNLKFQGECWVEVLDGKGDLVFSSLKRGGEEVTLRALTPINVKLGNGDVVDVEFNHQPVPFTTRPDRKVVRLTLGE